MRLLFGCVFVLFFLCVVNICFYYVYFLAAWGLTPGGGEFGCHKVWQIRFGVLFITRGCLTGADPIQHGIAYYSKQILYGSSSTSSSGGGSSSRSSANSSSSSSSNSCCLFLAR